MFFHLLAPKLLFGSRVRRNSVSRLLCEPKRSFWEVRSQTEVWERATLNGRQHKGGGRKTQKRSAEMRPCYRGEPWFFSVSFGFASSWTEKAVTAVAL